MSDQRYLPYDDDLRSQLDVLQEECAEVIVAVSKLKRFGDRSVDRMTGVHYNNRDDLYAEMADLADAWARVQRVLS